MSKPYQDKDWLQRQYWENGLTLHQVAEVGGCNFQTIRFWLRKHGIRTRDASETSKLSWENYPESRIAGMKAAHARGCWTAESERKKIETFKLNWTEEKSLARSSKVKALWADGVYDGEETREKMAAHMRDQWESGQFGSEEWCKQNAEHMRKAWRDGKIGTPKALEGSSERLKSAWRDGGFLSHQVGQDHPRWCGGVKGYPEEWTEPFKRSIRGGRHDRKHREWERALFGA